MQPMIARNRYSNGLELTGAFDASSLWGDEPVPGPRIYATVEACRMLGCDRTTLLRWLHKAGMQSVDDPADGRVTGYTHGQLSELAKRHHRFLGEPPAQPEPSRRMRELEHRVAVLEATVARLEAQHPDVRSDNVTRPLPRQNRSTVRHSGKYPMLPEGAITFRQLVVVEFGADERSADKWGKAGELPKPTRGGQWYDPRTKGVASRIYLAEQIPAARAALERLTGQATGEQ